jgi:hypothetical protein
VATKRGLSGDSSPEAELAGSIAIAGSCQQSCMRLNELHQVGFFWNERYSMVLRLASLFTWKVVDDAVLKVGEEGHYVTAWIRLDQDLL